MSSVKLSHSNSSLGSSRRDLKRGGPTKRGRPPKKAFINVLVRTSTRSALTQMKASIGLPSQGEVIDYLVERAHVIAQNKATAGA